MVRAHFRFVPSLLALGGGLLLGSCVGTITSKDKGNSDNCQGILIDGQCVFPTSQQNNSDWHPDPDGDNTVSDEDNCRYVYNPSQTDSDSDGVGDLCDSDFVQVNENGPVVDLRAEHVTPYGGWFRFTSPESARYGRDYVIAWSESRADVETQAGIQGLPEDQKMIFRVYARSGDLIEKPQILTGLDPDTNYFLSARPLDDADQPSAKDGNVLEIRTAPAPTVSTGDSYPRVWATSEQLAAMKERHDSGDAAFAKWESVLESRSLGAGGVSAGEAWYFRYCTTAALLYHATGNTEYRDAAATLLDTLISYWADNELEHNVLRWADSNLAICADLLWNELSNEKRNQVVAAYLPDDEAADNTRLADTDEYASITRSWVVDGLVGCNASGVSADLSQRACALLEKGKRAFYGVQLVKARRNEGMWAQSGGALPDGIGYGLGSAKYWMDTLHALANTQGQVLAYAPWVWHNLLSLQVHALTPMKRGYATYGDLDAYDNFDVEPNSLPIQGVGGLVGTRMSFLSRAGMDTEAARAKWHVNTVYPDEPLPGYWSMLLFDSEEIPEVPNNEELSHSFVDSGMDMLYDRTSWDDDASYFLFKAGWAGPDHSHEDAGSFQLYRNGVWVTHESLGYDGPSASANAHNVPALSIDFEGEDARVGQFALVPAKPSFMERHSSQVGYTFASANLTGAYSSGRYQSFLYDHVERQVLWLKPTATGGDDRVIVYDLIDSSEETDLERSWQMHIDGTPELEDSRATYVAGSHVEVTLAIPAGIELSYQAPEGSHSEYPGEIYTGRIRGNAESSAKQLRYVSVLRASDDASSQVVEGFESDAVLGVRSGSEFVVFQRFANAGGNEDQDAAVDTTGIGTVFWTGLTPGEKYSIVASESGLQLRVGGDLEADEGGLVVTTL